ncbi:MAG: tRNA dihydrouridine(20/20a) synthase DusA [Deltaproteobacteria bacterium]|nr:tRNA dihydrouridine(20/20a) synthase DusA [Deltaproteobacteria bacterium]
MMDRTDRHLRWFLRQLTRQTLLYTEMVTTPAILRGRRLDLLAFSPEERPLALQLGGDDPRGLAACARIAEDLGYDEVNINVGCPSDKVQRGRFGACLMAEPALVGEMVEAMRQATTLPVTVKHRIGIDDRDAYDDMRRFIDTVAAAGADRFTVHARKAWLTGLSPKENRTVPPLRYEDVYRLKAERPELVVEINGGIRTLEAARQQLARVDAVMIGRAAYETPWVLARADSVVFGRPSDPLGRRTDAIRAAAGYVASSGIRLHQLGRHITELFHGEAHARRWKHGLANEAHATGPAAARALERLADVMEQGLRDDGPITPSIPEITP